MTRWIPEVNDPNWRYIRFPLTSGNDVELWLPKPFSARDLRMLEKWVDLLGEAWFSSVRVNDGVLTIEASAPTVAEAVLAACEKRE